MDKRNGNELEEFQSQGFLAFDPEIDPATIDTALGGLKDIYLPEGAPEDNFNGKVAMRNNRRVQDAWKFREVTLEDVDAYQAKGQIGRALAKVRSYLNPIRNTDADYAIYERIFRENMAASGITPQYATIRKGQAFIWAANLVHGGSSQHDRSRTRLSQVTHYFFEGCRYYTPLMRRGFKTFWRSPDWIV